jgi:hypothetical protein
MEVEKVEQETEWIPILKFVKILSEKGINITVGSVANGMAIGSVRGKLEDGKWYIAKEEMVRRGKRQEAGADRGRLLLAVRLHLRTEQVRY